MPGARVKITKLQNNSTKEIEISICQHLILSFKGFTILIPDYTSSTSISTCHFEQVVPVPGLFLDFTTMSLLVAVPNHFVRVVSGLFGHVYSHLSWLSCPINFPLPCIVC